MKRKPAVKRRARKPAPEARPKGRKRAVMEEPETLPLFGEETR